jgi:DNA polymerase-3 subunit epsilon
MEKDEIYSLPVDKINFTVVDLETTGFSPNYNRIIEIGLVKVSELEIKETFHSMVNPGRAIPFYISNFTGITNDDIYDAPFFEDIASDLLDFISEDIIAGHNVTFDKSFLRREFLLSGFDFRRTSLCTLRLSRRLLPALRSRSLNSLCRHFHIKNSNAHRALADAGVTAEILIRIIKELKKTNEVNSLGELLNYQFFPHTLRRTERINKKLQSDIAALPDAPGIYYFLNSKKKIIYIGKAKSLKDRVKSYFSPAAPQKAKKIIRQAARLKIKLTNSELTALLSEAESIKVENPKHNTQLKKYGNKYFLRITSAHSFPRIEITNYFDFDGNDYFGLFLTKKKAASLHEMLSRTFLIRECSDVEFSKSKVCFLAHIERCTAPCENKDKIIYNGELEKVYEFLYGKNQFALNRLLNKMKEYSSRLKFEKAAEVKQLIDIILAQTHKSSILAEPVNRANVLFEINEGYLRDYILMISGKIYVKKNALADYDDFEEAINDYFKQTINLKLLPEEEDLEKMKITLNWLVKNRNKVRVFYLKDYVNKNDLYSRLTHYGVQQELPLESSFNIKNFMKEEAESIG